jgi:hypothetical protein
VAELSVHSGVKAPHAYLNDNSVGSELARACLVLHLGCKPLLTFI